MILITGAAGFIGSVLAHRLNALGEMDLILVDRLRTGQKWKNLLGVQFSEFIHADELFLEENSLTFSRVNKIFHMGACSSTTERDVDYLMKNNVEYSKNLFKIAVEKEIPIIYASSAATYGNGELGYDDDQRLVDQLRPLNPYGFSKQVFDQWALKQKKVPPKWFGLKFFNVYGPNEEHKDGMRSLVSKSFEQINENGFVKLFKSHRDDYKDGEQLRDFVYVKDVVEAMIELMKVSGRESGIYNMGTGTERSFYDLVAATFKAMNLEINVEFIDMPESIRGQYQYYTKANMKKFSNILPDFNFHTLEEGVFDYVSNYLIK